MISMHNARQALIATAAGFALLAGGAARAADTKIVSMSELWSAYQAICIAHAGDQAGQIAAAKAAPYNFVQGEASEDGSLDFENERMSLSLLDNEEDHFCMVLAPVDPATKASDAVRVAQPTLGKPEKVEDVRAVWTKGDSNPPAIHLFRVKATNSGVLLGGFVQGTM